MVRKILAVVSGNFAFANEKPAAAGRQPIMLPVYYSSIKIIKSADLIK